MTVFNFVKRMMLIVFIMKVTAQQQQQQQNKQTHIPATPYNTYMQHSSNNNYYNNPYKDSVKQQKNEKLNTGNGNSLAAYKIALEILRKTFPYAEIRQKPINWYDFWLNEHATGTQRERYQKHTKRRNFEIQNVALPLTKVKETNVDMEIDDNSSLNNDVSINNNNDNNNNVNANSNSNSNDNENVDENDLNYDDDDTTTTSNNKSNENVYEDTDRLAENSLNAAINEEVNHHMQKPSYNPLRMYSFPTNENNDRQREPSQHLHATTKRKPQSYVYDTEHNSHEFNILKELAKQQHEQQQQQPYYKYAMATNDLNNNESVENYHLSANNWHRHMPTVLNYKRSAAASNTQTPKTFLPSISAGAMTHLGDFFKDLSKNVHFTEKSQLGEEEEKLLEGDHPLRMLHSEVAADADQQFDGSQSKTAQFLHALRTYRPSQKIRSLVAMNPQGYHGSHLIDPNYMWVGLGK